MFKSPSLLLSDSSFLKIVLKGQHWEAFVPDAGALSTITARSTAARLEVHLGAAFQPTKTREAISETLTWTWSHPASFTVTSGNATTTRTQRDGTHWEM